MQPAVGNLASQIQDYSQQLKAINSDKKLSSTEKFFQKEDKIFAPLAHLLSKLDDKSLAQPGVRESLKELKKIVKNDDEATTDLKDKIAKLSKQSKVATPSKEKAVQSSGKPAAIPASEPSKAEQDEIDEFVTLIGETQRGDKSITITTNIQQHLMQVTRWGITPHPELQNLIKELRDALKETASKEKVVIGLINHCDKLLQGFKDEPYNKERAEGASESRKTAEEYETKKAHDERESAQKAKADEAARAKKSEEIISSQYVRYFKDDLEKILATKDKKDFTDEAFSFINPSHRTDGPNEWTKLPKGSLELLDKVIARLKKEQAHEAVIEYWEDLRNAVDMYKPR